MTDTTWPIDETSTFGDRLAAARGAAGLSQPDLARHCGVRVSSIRSWEDDQSEPRANTLQRLSGILGVSLMWLLNGEGESGIAAELETPGDLRDLLLELRSVRADHAKTGDRLGRLEKRLRLSLATEMS